ncbi:TetR family transcriptional regulator [Mycobacterium colombiense]|uniref:TetR/AcrR family transcriptional regulator n=1 Tax=Mycobacterium colombiense TaxID=339268 RepID=UPI0007EF305C|nr:TetR/AcrR family transcriptional regulator [Mycobacterium colombiense]OBK67137.1 TetR family transcriptional regulator [Mycobacterium colombiense]
MTFQRARSEEHREIRRQAILDTASAMLESMSVGEITLNELSRRGRLAKSAMLRYFESREAVLLELLDVALRRWVTEVVAELPRNTRSPKSAHTRGDHMAALLSRSLQQHAVLCDLIAAQPGVLEHNVSAETLLRFKQSFHASINLLAEAIRHYIPELGDDSQRVCLLTLVTTGALWIYGHPSVSAVRACQADPALAGLRLDFTSDLEETLARLIAGTLVRRAT